MIFGHPFHGLVQKGQLTLPNGQTMTYQQPASGDCLLLRVPGVAAVVRSATEQAADVAAGFQWLDYALISGTSCQLYGKPMPASYGGSRRWVWATAATRTLCEVLDTSIFSGVLTVNIRLRVLGGLGHTAAWSFFSPTVSGDVGATFVRVLDSAPDGSKAAILFDDAGRVSNVEVDLSSGVPVLSVAYGRADCDVKSLPGNSDITSDVLGVYTTIYGLSTVRSPYRGTATSAYQKIIFAWYEGGELVPVRYRVDSSESHAYYGFSPIPITNSSGVIIEIDSSGGTMTISSAFTAALIVEGRASSSWRREQVMTIIRSPDPFPTETTSTVGDASAGVSFSTSYQAGLVWASHTSQGATQYLGFVAKNGGSDSSLVTTPEGTSQYHTAHPLTGQIIRNQSTPVCWV